MLSKLDTILSEAKELINSANDSSTIESVEVKYLSKKGALTEVLKSLGKIPGEQRKEVGQKANLIKKEITELLDAKKSSLNISSDSSKCNFDLTLPGKSPRRGGIHPIIKEMYALNDAFHSLGFEVYDGPEISSESFAFDSLNFPEDHPARESMDTYWLDGYENNSGANRLCLRPHLTGGSVRYMLQNKPPFRFVYPGRVFRNESTDASHERAFFQYEALIVDKEVPFSSVRVLVNTILEKVFGRTVETRMRSGFFPFVEPGFEIDMQCLVCEGKGCSVCSHVGWIELMPGGPPHPNVLKAGGIDPEIWQGAYINIGLDRLVMMKYGIDDVRLFHSTDLRFLSQFN